MDDLLIDGHFGRQFNFHGVINWVQWQLTIDYSNRLVCVLILLYLQEKNDTELKGKIVDNGKEISFIAIFSTQLQLYHRRFFVCCIHPTTDFSWIQLLDFLNPIFLEHLPNYRTILSGTIANVTWCPNHSILSNAKKWPDLSPDPSSFTRNTSSFKGCLPDFFFLISSTFWCNLVRTVKRGNGSESVGIPDSRERRSNSFTLNCKPSCDSMTLIGFVERKTVG